MAVPYHVAFDLETTGIDLDNDDITCAATRAVDEHGTTIRIWHSNMAATISVTTLVELIDYLDRCTQLGMVVVTFNGAKFDFAMLAKKVAAFPETVAKVKRLAADHHDIMLQFATEHGYFASLDSFAIGCGLEPKTWDGKAAAEAWASGDIRAKKKVLAYCGEDVRCLSDPTPTSRWNGGRTAKPSGTPCRAYRSNVRKA